MNPAHALSLLAALAASQAHAQGYVKDSDGMNVMGKVVQVQLMAKEIKLPRGQTVTAMTVGALLTKGQTALFELEIQDRDLWNDSNSYSCDVVDHSNQSEITTVSLPAINTSQYLNQTTLSGTPRLTSGTHTWAFVADASGAAIFQDIVCKGAQYGGPDNHGIFVRVKKTILSP